MLAVWCVHPEELALATAPDVGACRLTPWSCWGRPIPGQGRARAGPGLGTERAALGSVCSRGLWALPQVIQPPPKPGALIRPPQVTLTQTPMVALRQPHNRIVLTTPQQIQLNQLQPGEGLAGVHGTCRTASLSS